MNMENSVPLLTTRMSYQLNLLRSLSLIWTSTFFTLRQSGVLTEKTIMKGMFVCMLITGRTIGGSRLSLTTPKKCVKIGIQKTLLLPTKMDVN